MLTTICKLSDVATLVRGVSFDKEEASDVASDDMVPILRAGNIAERLILDQNLVWVPKGRVSDIQYLRSHDIAICMSSGSPTIVGKTATCADDWLGSVGAFCAIVRPNPMHILPEFLAFFLQSQVFREWTRQSSGANIKNIRKSELEAFAISVPAREEQQRIVDILSRAEGIVRLRREAQQKAAEIIPALFLDMFGDPATNPKGWPTATISELCELVRGSSPRPQGDPRYFIGPVPRLMIADITRDGVYVTPHIDSLTLEGAKKSRPMKAGDVVMAVSGAVGLPGILAIDACIHDGFVGFRNLDQRLSAEFFYNFLTCYRRLSVTQAVGATFQNLKTDQIRVWRVPLPPPEQQRTFLQLTERLRAMEEQQASALKTAQSTFDALLAQSFPPPTAQ
jgi:restriction endonuclease S subunit